MTTPTEVITPRPLEPVRASERIESLDILRGFAIFGILLVNMGLFMSPMQAMMSEEKFWTSTNDRVTEWAIIIFAQGKFYTLFSFLFGLGFYILMTRAEARGARLGPLYRRRLLVLLMIGLVHALLIWFGDILALYAMVGFLLLLFRKRRPKTILVWAMIAIFTPTVLMFGLVASLEMGRLNPETAAEIDQELAKSSEEARAGIASALQAYGTGSFAQVTQQRVADVAMLYSWSAFFAPNVLGTFLLGLWVGRRGVFENLSAHLPWLRRVNRWGLALGAIGNVAAAVLWQNSSPTSPTWASATATFCQAFGAPALSFFYASAILLLAQDPACHARLRPLAAVGRMALTNYLLQSLVCTTIFYSYGLALYGKVGLAQGVLLTLVIYTSQIPLSVWWLLRFRFGPAEWLWRSLTYGRWQPLRAAAAATV